jgi:hypothetical protein
MAALDLPRVSDTAQSDTKQARFVYEKKTLTSAADTDQAAFIINQGRGDLLEPFIKDDYKLGLQETLLPIEDVYTLPSCHAAEAGNHW